MITLYKYRPFNDHLKPIIISQKIWFPTRSRLNDPEDLALSVINNIDAEAYRRYLEKEAESKLWSRKALKANLKRAFTAKGTLAPQARKRIGDAQDKMQKYLNGIGILSLSEVEDSPLLWERYGDRGQGVCIVFELEQSETLHKVEYKTPRPQFSLSELLLCDNIPSDNAVKKFSEGLRTKDTKWRDECEWRFFLQHGNAEFTVPGAIKAIWLGRKALDTSRQTMTQWVAEAGQPIQIKFL